MTTKSKQLVRAGHELASELKADCGAVDMRSVANLLTELASALDVQSARSDALAAKLNDVCAENAALRDSVEHAGGCIHAAEVEGLIEALECRDGERLANLVHRRLCHAYLPVETPNTDAWVNEQRAAGVEKFAANERAVAKRYKEKGGNPSSAAVWFEVIDSAMEFAAQLRGSQV